MSMGVENSRCVYKILFWELYGVFVVVYLLRRHSVLPTRRMR